MDDFQGAFNDADIVLVAPVYAAGEEPIEGVDHDGAGRGAEAARPSRGGGGGRRRTTSSASSRELAAPGDMIICLGAGDITKWAARPRRRDPRRALGSGGMSAVARPCRRSAAS